MLSQLSMSYALRELVDVSVVHSSGRHQSDSLLWAMRNETDSRNTKAERQRTKGKRRYSKAWWEHSEDYVDPAMGLGDAYLTKWRGDCERRKFADDETALAADGDRHKASRCQPTLSADYEPPMHEKMQLLVALCFQLQRINNPHRFILAHAMRSRCSKLRRGRSLMGLGDSRLRTGLSAS